MAKGSLIGWLHRPGYTAATWNIVMGCTPVSKGCDFCFAPRDVARQEHLPGREGLTYSWDGHRAWSGKVALLEERLDQPTRWRKPHMIFVTVLGDLFNAKVPEEFIARVWQVMAATPQHIYIILTKQPKRMRDIVRRLVDRFGVLPNVHLGVSAEDQDNAATRIHYLLTTPAAVRAVSCEPLLGPIDLTRLHLGGGRYLNALTGDLATDKGEIYTGAPSALDWVIAGGESGPGARPMHPDWARQLRDQTTAAGGAAFFFKQWGEHLPVPIVDAPGYAGGRAIVRLSGGLVSATIRERGPSRTFRSGEHRPLRPGDTNGLGTMLDHDLMALRVGKKAAGDVLDGRTWHQWPDGHGLIIDDDQQTIGAQ